MKPLILVHGFLGGCAQWNGIKSAIKAHPIIAPNLPGFGTNNHLPPCKTISEIADFVVDLANQRKIEQFDLLGHSMGGMIAQEIALSYPDRVNRLILYSTGSIGELPGRFEPISVSKQRALNEGVPATVDRITATWYLDHENSGHHATCAAIARMVSQEALQSGLDVMAGWDRSSDIHRITAPTLIIWGESDRTYPIDQIQLLNREIKQSVLKIIPQAAHAIHDENRNAFLEALNTFLMHE